MEWNSKQKPANAANYKSILLLAVEWPKFYPPISVLETSLFISKSENPKVLSGLLGNQTETAFFVLSKTPGSFYRVRKRQFTFP